MKGQIAAPPTPAIQEKLPSKSPDLLGLIIFPMSLTVKEMLDRDLLAKNELKSSAFSLKSVMSLLSRKIGRIQGTF